MRLVDVLRCRCDGNLAEAQPLLLLTIFEFTDLTVLLLQLLADLLHGDVVAQRLGYLVDHLGGCVTCRPEVVTLNMGQKSDFQVPSESLAHIHSCSSLHTVRLRKPLEHQHRVLLI